MSKFKVGDRVTAKGNVNGFGGSGTVIKVDIGHPISEYLVKFDCGANNGIWALNDSVTPLHSDRHSIHITCTDGKTTHAVKKVDGKIVARSKAVCCPTDEFDFAVGANLAYDRLMRPESLVKAQPEQPKFKAGDRVRIIGNRNPIQHFAEIGSIQTVRRVYSCHVEIIENSQAISFADIEPYTEPKQEPVKLYCVADRSNCVGTLTKGKVYEFVNGDGLTYDNGAKSIETRTYGRWARDNQETSPCLVPLVNRPAEVGEWVYVTHTDYLSDLEVGDIAKVKRVNTAKSVYISKPDGHHPNGLNFGRHEYLVLDGYKPEPEKAEPEYLNMRVVCVKLNHGLSHTVGKAYEVKDGFLASDDSSRYNPWPYNTLDDLNKDAAADFIEFKGE